MFKITTSEKAIPNYVKCLVYHNGRMREINGADYIGRNGKIKAGWCYVYLHSSINPQIFQNEFNALNYSQTDKKIDTLTTFINSHRIIQSTQEIQSLSESRLMGGESRFQIESQMGGESRFQIESQMGADLSQKIPIPEADSSSSLGSQTPVYQSNTPHKPRTPKSGHSRETPDEFNEEQPLDSFPQMKEVHPVIIDTQIPSFNGSLFPNIRRITIECSTGTYTYEMPIDPNILNEIVNSLGLL